MSQNWLRHFELQLLRTDGGGIKLSGFKATFKVEWFIGTAPKVAELKIYNLALNTANKIIDKEFSKIRLFAGYDGLTPVVNESEVGVIHEISPDDPGQRGGRNYGLIFSGDIRITLAGSDGTPDTWLLVQAIDGHEAISYATISATLARGYTVKDMYDLALAGLKPYNITGGTLPDFPTTIFPRGYTFHGKVSSYLTQIATLCNASWELLDDRLEMYGKDHVVHPPVPLNTANGLTGMPQSTTGAGVNAKCLINPNIRLKGQILLNESLLHQAVPDLKKLTNRSFSPGKSKDGVYEIYGITYYGDTRGNDWYMDLMCQATGSKDPAGEGSQTKKSR
ncbi:hypothetical protein [Dryocola sp. BD613]|uniref:hypothetical protein n=1 Tax=Dryocola sp. BD613 TaxID=3133272 RepID=UPI003F500F07